MADEGDAGDKTEDPTERRKNEARKEGQVGVSSDLSNVVGITGAWLALQTVAPYLWNNILIIVRGSFTSRYGTQPIELETLRQQTISVVMLLLPQILAIMFIAAFCGAGCTALQNNFLWSWKLLKPKWKHVNPISGLQRIFSPSNGINLLKSIAKLCIIAPIAYMAFFDLFPLFMTLMEVPVTKQLMVTAQAASYIFWRIVSWLLVLAILDLLWQKWNTKRQMKMSKQEVKDEKKAVEGDEGTRRRIIAMGLARARERMMQSVPTADVVVTNPTHLAVALSYSMNAGSAPKVVAKGRGHVALRIRKIAREHGIPVVEKKSLARALFKAVEVGQEIPYELFKAVAELLAYVYKIKGRLPQKARSAIKKKRSVQTAGY